MTESFAPTNRQRHVLLLIPDEKECRWAAQTLAETKIQSHECADMEDLCRKASLGFGAILLGEETLEGENGKLLSDFLGGQESWSDIPVLLIAAARGTSADQPVLSVLKKEGNLTILQRPLQEVTLASSLQVALRARRWQYEVRELLAQRHSVLASINDSFVMVDRDWKFVYVNQKAADMYGVAREKLLGRVLWNALPELAVEPYQTRLHQAAESQQEFQAEYFHPPSQRWFEKRIYPSRTGVSIFATDITERKHAEEKLRYQLGITQAITDNAADSLFLLDPRGRVTFMNPAAEETFGWRKEELLGKVLHDYVHYHKTQSAKIDCPLHSVFTSGLTLRDLEDEFHCKDGSRLNVSCSNAAIVMDGAPTGAVLVVHDITYHKLAEQQLKALNENLELRVAERTAVAEQRAAQLTALALELTQTEQRERRRLAHILHDNLQQMLVATKLQVSMLRSRLEEESARKDMLQIEDLLNRSVDESRSLTVELSPPILYDAGLARALEWLARRMQQEQGLTVEIEADPDAEPEGDDIRAFLFQSVREALFNIVKHAGVTKASVSIGFAGKGFAAIQIRDEGRGFELQTDDGKDFSSGGFGLFSIRERIEYLGGRMVITSAPNLGTTVSLYVPVREESHPALAESANGEEQDRADSSQARTATASGNVIRVLLVDDHKMLRDGLAGLLREQPDIEVISEASDGLMAIELAHKSGPDVVIMDVTMPRMNGVEATRRLKEELPHIKVIGLSMHEKDDMAKAMREAGAVSYVTKGAPSEILTAAIRNCMIGEHVRLRPGEKAPSQPAHPTKPLAKNKISCNL
jgi:PAS domain S-box-containing protein